MPWLTGGFPHRMERPRAAEREVSGSAAAIIRLLAFWRRGPRAARSAGTLPALAILGILFPLLFAVAAQYSTPIIPDFDDYDWDGPDDDTWADQKSRSGQAPHDALSPGSHGAATAARSCAVRFDRTSLLTRGDRRPPQRMSLPHRLPLLFRGPPEPTGGAVSRSRFCSRAA